MAFNRTYIIVNPAAGAGKAGNALAFLWELAKKSFGSSVSFQVTKKQGDATLYAREAIWDGAGLLVAVGGDGTIQEVVNGFFYDYKPVNPDCKLGIINFGTGSGLAQSLGLPGSIEHQFNLLSDSAEFNMDVGRVSWKNKIGEPVFRYFINECQAGIGGAVVAGMDSKHKHLGGKLAFGTVTIKQTFRYKGFLASLGLEGRHIDRELTGVVFGNGSHCGGGMQLTPKARLDDGLFDILLIHKTSIPRLLHSFTQIYSGKHIESKHFTCLRSNRISIETDDPVPIEADGELLGSGPFEIRLIPSAITVKANYEP